MDDADRAMSSWRGEACRLLSLGISSSSGGGSSGGLAFDRERGVFLSPTSAATTAKASAFAGRRRTWTWEDTLNVSRLQLRASHPIFFWNTSSRSSATHSDPSDLEKLAELRTTHRCRRRWHCEHVGLPMAIRTVQRPVKAFVVQSPAGRLLFGMPIEKAGLSSFDDFFKRLAIPGRSRAMISSNWAALQKHPRCQNTTGIRLIETVASLAERAATTTTIGIAPNAHGSVGHGQQRANKSKSSIAGTHRFLDSDGHAAMLAAASRACGLASSFALGASAPRGPLGSPSSARHATYAFTVVRDPVARFVSGFSDHSTTVHRPTYSGRTGGRLTPSIRETVSRLAQHAARLASGRFSVALVPPHATIHFLSQSYFLSGTDAYGEPIQWDLIARLEDIDADLRPVIEQFISPSHGGPLGSARTRDHSRKRPTAAALAERPLQLRPAPAAPSVSTPGGASMHGRPSLGGLGYRFPHKNAKHSTEARDALLKRVRAHATLMCDLCQVYGQDFVCLGYPVPAACLEPRCSKTLRPELRAALLRSLGERGAVGERPMSSNLEAGAGHGSGTDVRPETGDVLTRVEQ